MKLDKKQESILDSLKSLKLYGMANDLENQFINEGVYSTVTFVNRIEQMIQNQISYTLERKYASLVKRAKIKDSLSFNELKYNQKEDGITQDEVAFLASNSWATVNVMNVIIQGPTGSGKKRIEFCNGIKPVQGWCDCKVLPLV